VVRLDGREGDRSRFALRAFDWARTDTQAGRRISDWALLDVAAAAPVAWLNWWRGMLRMAKRRRPSGSVSKSADENLDRLFTGMNLDTNRRIAKVNLVASSVLSSNDGVGHYRFAL
jgi:hypothetical protein